jgi:hypothetical protein
MKRHHHFVPRFMLKKMCYEGHLYVYDKVRRQIYKGDPNGAGFEDSLYKIIDDRYNSDYIEDGLSKIESVAAPIISKIEQEKALPEGEEFEKLMLFLACMSSRNPAVISSSRDFLEDVVRKTAILVVENKHEEMLEEHPELRDMKYTKEELIQLISDPNRIKIEIFNTILMEIMFKEINTLAQILIKRPWYIGYISDNSTAKYITSDQPMLLYWNQPGCEHYSPGFALGATTVCFVVNPKLAIISEMDVNLTSPIRMKHYYVREINKMHFHLSERFVYSQDEVFYYNSERNEKTSNILDDI